MFKPLSDADVEKFRQRCAVASGDTLSYIESVLMEAIARIDALKAENEELDESYKRRSAELQHALWRENRLKADLRELRETSGKVCDLILGCRDHECRCEVCQLRGLLNRQGPPEKEQSWASLY